MICSKCNRVLQPGDELKWECNSCHQFCRANLQMLEQIQTQRENGYTAAMVNCPFCGTVLDDGNETIHWDCIACGNRTTTTIKNYVRPEMFEEKEEPEQEDSSNQSEFSWFDSNGEAMEAPPEEPPSKQKGFFANEEEKNEFLAETKSQALGEEIPDSIFDDVPMRKPKSAATVASEQKVAQTTTPVGSVPSGDNPVNTAPVGTSASVASPGTASVGGNPTNTALSGTASVGGNPANTASPGTASVGGNPTNTALSGVASPGSSPQGATSASGTSGMSPFVEPPTEQTKPMSAALPSSSTPIGSSPANTASPGVTSAGGSRVNTTSPGVTSAGSSPANTVSSGVSSSGAMLIGGMPTGGASARAASAGSSPANAVSSGVASPGVTSAGGSRVNTVSSDSSSSTPDFSRYEPPGSSSKQILPKILTGILSVLIVAAIIVGGYFTIRFFMAPTRQFRSAVQAADYTKASEIYNSKIKGNTDDERVAKIAVEHFLHERYEVFKNGGGEEDAYRQILEFAQNEMGMDTSEYELGNEPEETPEPMETPEPTESPAVEETEEPSETPEPTPEETVVPEETPEPTPEVTEPPEEPVEDPQTTGTEEEITAAIQKANKYVNKKKYEKAYNYLAEFKDADTTGQIKKEMSSIKKEWKSYNITTFKTLCSKLSIVYYASEKQYHIVPKGYYTNYNQISRSNNVGGIAYMDQQKKKVSITNIGKDGALSSFGKTNRANLNQFKEMIEKYPYLAKEIK